MLLHLGTILSMLPSSTTIFINPSFLCSFSAHWTSIMQGFQLRSVYPKSFQEFIYLQGFNLADSQNGINPLPTLCLHHLKIIFTYLSTSPHSTYPKFNSFYPPIPTLPKSSFPISNSASINDHHLPTHLSLKLAVIFFVLHILDLSLTHHFLSYWPSSPFHLCHLNLCPFTILLNYFNSFISVVPD